MELTEYLDYLEMDHNTFWQNSPSIPEAVLKAVEAARLVADPNLKAMGKVNYALSHNDYSEAELQSLFDAALTRPGDTK